jgi:hypothetical protein
MITRERYLENMSYLIIQGTPYKWGGMDIDGCDCSGAVCYCMEWNDKKNAQQIYEMFKANRIERLQSQPGSLIFYGDSLGLITHVMSVISRWPNGALVIAGARGGDSTTTNLDRAKAQRAFVDTCFGDYWLDKYVTAVDPFKL